LSYTLSTGLNICGLKQKRRKLEFQQKIKIFDLSNKSKIKSWSLKRQPLGQKKTALGGFQMQAI